MVLKKEKCAVANINSFLGLSGIFPNIENKMTLSISLTPEKSLKWARMITEIVSNRTISRSSLESLIGKLSFPKQRFFVDSQER